MSSPLDTHGRWCGSVRNILSQAMCLRHSRSVSEAAASSWHSGSGVVMTVITSQSYRSGLPLTALRHAHVTVRRKGSADSGTSPLWLPLLTICDPHRRSQRLRHYQVIPALSCTMLTLTPPCVQTSNAETIEWYQRRGFEAAETIRNYYKRIDCVDAVVLRRRLEPHVQSPAHTHHQH